MQASARHILVQTKEEALTLQQQLVQNTEDDDQLFSTLATQYSTCPSGKQAGGALGSFSPGTMVRKGNCGHVFHNTMVMNVYGCVFVVPIVSLCPVLFLTLTRIHFPPSSLPTLR